MAVLDCLFYVGSAMSFDPRGQKIARAFVRILQQAGVRFGILGAREGSTGECVRRVGNEMLFRQLATALSGTLGELGVKRIVTCDPHALNSLRNEYPEFGARLRGGPPHPADRRAARRRPHQVDASLRARDLPRPVLPRAATTASSTRRARSWLGSSSDAPLEFALSREKSMCCGAGGGRMWIDETIGKRINIARVEQALEAAPRTIATACPYCAVMVADGLGALQPDGATQSRDIAELVADAMRSTSAPAGTPGPSRRRSAV